MIDLTYSYLNNTDSPYAIIYYNHHSIAPHWHPEMEIFYVLSGTVSVNIEDKFFSASEEAIFLVNAGDFHALAGNDCKLFSIRFSTPKLPYYAAENNTRFLLNSTLHESSNRYDFIRMLVSQLIKSSESASDAYMSMSLIYSIYNHLKTNFLAEPMERTVKGALGRERLSEILKYVSEHYAECLTLNEVSAHFGLTPPYFSSFFKKSTGSNFMTYYNEYRLTRAVTDLLSSDATIEQIALSNGFHDSPTFLSHFKKKYNTVPSVFRKTMSLSSANIIIDSKHDTEELTGIAAIRKILSYKSLMKYENYYENSSSNVPVRKTMNLINAPHISLTGSFVNLQHHFRKVMCVGSAKQFLYREIQDMISKTQDEIGYEFVKFHGIFSDEMMVYNEKMDGTPVFSFTLIDKVIDFLLSVNLRPICQLSFMPIALSKNPERLVDFYHYNTAPPKSMAKWGQLVNAFIMHVIKRYGINEVSQWPFCVWNEPDGTTKEFSWDNQSLFFDFYKYTYDTAKKACPGICFGTPSLGLSILEDKGWAADFFTFCHENGCMPDFINIHFYDNTLFASDRADRNQFENFSTDDIGKSFPLSEDPYAFMKFINNLKLRLRRYQLKNIPVYLTEWNLTISHRDLINDTCFKACYLAKNLLENYDRLEAFGYWCLTDFIEEMPLSSNLFHGGLGMFTHNGIPKAHYNVFRFISCLQNQFLAKGNGYFVSKGESTITMILYNYSHFSSLSMTPVVNGTNQNRYIYFSSMDNAQFEVYLEDIPANYNSCSVKELFINQQYGSSYDAWENMGAVPLTTANELALLKTRSEPGSYLHRETITDQTLHYQTQLLPFEIRLVVIDLFDSE